MRRPLIFGHRGAKSLAPENTLTAFRMAQDIGADGVEFDVQFSADRQLVVIHDRTLERTTNGHGRVADLTLAELQRLDAGVHFNPPFSGERIPTLQEVFQLPGRPLQLNIEIKIDPGIQQDTGLEKAIAKAVRDGHMQSRVLVSSFNYYSLRRMRQLAPEIRLGVLYNHGIEEDEIAALCAEALHPGWRLVDEALVQRAHARDQQVNVWTVNEEADMRAMIALGVDTIMTDYPQRLVALLNE